MIALLITDQSRFFLTFPDNISIAPPKITKINSCSSEYGTFKRKLQAERNGSNHSVFLLVYRLIIAKSVIVIRLHWFKYIHSFLSISLLDKSQRSVLVAALRNVLHVYDVIASNTREFFGFCQFCAQPLQQKNIRIINSTATKKERTCSWLLIGGKH